MQTNTIEYTHLLALKLIYIIFYYFGATFWILDNVSGSENIRVGQSNWTSTPMKMVLS